MRLSRAMGRCRMTVFRPGRRKRYVMRWTDPRTGQRRERSTRTVIKRDAYDVATELAEKIAGGISADDTWWDDFCHTFEEDVEQRRSRRAQEPWKTTKKHIAELQPITKLSEVTSSWVSMFQAKLRRKELSENTVSSYLARLRIAMNWARERGLVTAVPVFRLTIEEAPRSRAITAEEFERVLAAAPKIRPADGHAFARLLRGLWWSGFRISELIALSWDVDAPVRLNAAGKLPVVELAAMSNKSRKPRVRPILPEFWDVCCETPESKRTGPIFPLPGPTGAQLSVKRIVRIVSRIGTKAGVITNTGTGKLATSHDLRRALTMRLDGRLTLAELQKWMGHASIDTTLTYYHTAEAQQLAEKLWGKRESGATSGAPSSVASERERQRKR